jgi:hypothetical protein
VPPAGTPGHNDDHQLLTNQTLSEVENKAAKEVEEEKTLIARHASTRCASTRSEQPSTGAQHMQNSDHSLAAPMHRRL